MCKEQVIFESESGAVIDVTALVGTTQDPSIITNNLSLSTMDRHNFMYKFAEANPAKGKKGGSCNITQCQKGGASCYNGGTHAYYCTKCWDDIYQSATYHGLEPQDWIRPKYRQEDYFYVYHPEEPLEKLENLYQKVQSRTKQIYKGEDKQHPLSRIFGSGKYDSHMPWVREQPKIGRNSTCPCGSGKKYKKCCEVYNG